MRPLILALALFLPFAAHADDFSSPESRVVIPWNDFKALYEQGKAPKDKPAPAPRDATLDSAVYSGTVVGEGDDAFASMKLVLKGQVLKPEGWAAVPLLSADTALKSAKINGKDAPIYIDRGFYTFVTNKPGAFVAELEFAARLTKEDGTTFFSFPLAPSGATNVSFTVDSPDGIDFEVANARGLTQGVTGNVHRVDATLPATGSLALSWQRHVIEEKAQEARVYAETQTLVGVSEGVLQAHATVHYTILHKGVQALRFKLPGDVVVLDVQGPGMRDWKQQPDGSILMTLNYDAIGSYQVVVDYERASVSGNLPLVSVLDVAREKSWVGVDARSAVELVAGKAVQATPVDVRELPASLIGQTDFPVLLAWKARGGEVQIPLEVRTHPDVDMLVTLVDTCVAETLVTVDGRRMTRVRYAVRNNRNQFLHMKVPEGGEVWSASVAGRGVKLAKGDGDILIPLVRSDSSGGSLSAFLVEVVYVEGGAALGTGGTLRLDLPRVDAPTSQLQWTVFFPGQAKVDEKSFEGSVRMVEGFSATPQLPREATVTRTQTGNQQAAAAQQADAGALGQGVEPVKVNLPLSGQQLRHEKNLVLDEELWTSFDYKLKEK